MDREEDKCLLLLPTTVSHKIDFESPFYNLTPEKLAESNFELVFLKVFSMTTKNWQKATLSWYTS